MTPDLRPAESKARSGQSTFEYLLMITIVLVVISVGVYFTLTSPERDYFTIEGRITQIWGGERTTITWDDNDGSHGLTFVSTSLPLPIGENVRITYYYIGSHSSYPIIENIVILEGYNIFDNVMNHYTFRWSRGNGFFEEVGT